MSRFSLEGKVALVNGGSRGIGEAIAHEFARGTRRGRYRHPRVKQDGVDAVA
jgi:NAD(P)-dependent dehydrogenase (short-subunit alcohol dehydrogenase family)